MANKAKNKATALPTESEKLRPESVGENCPLCLNPETYPEHRDRCREYLRCRHCDLIFVPSIFHLSPEDEKAIYDYHENDPKDPGYRKFLERLSIPLSQKLPNEAIGLDFGCGPGPALSEILRAQGHTMSEFDLYYANNDSLLKQQYDFITSTEVIEHLRKPGEVLDLLFSLIREEGTLGIMTKRTPSTGIEGWHYIRDTTHICFFSDQTFEYIAERYACALTLMGDDTAILTKLPATQ